MLNQVSKTRDGTLDALKGIGILFVVLGHSWIVLSAKGELFRIIFSFHMPLFFFVSGVLLRTEMSLSSFAYARAQSLLKPFLAMLLVIAAVTIVARLAGDEAVDRTTWLRPLIWLYGTGPLMPWHFNPLWFLPHLFLAVSLSFLIIRGMIGHKDRHKWLLALLMFLVGAGTIDIAWGGGNLLGLTVPPGWGLPWSLDLLLLSTSFVIVGYLLKEQVANFEVMGGGLVLAVLLFATMHFAFDETIDLNLRVYGSTPVATAQAAAGVYICLSLAQLAQRRKWMARILAYLGSGSLFIFMFHYFVHNVAMWSLPRYVESKQTAAVIAFVLAIVLPMAMFELSQRVGVLRYCFLPLRSAPVTQGTEGPATRAPTDSR